MKSLTSETLSRPTLRRGGIWSQRGCKSGRKLSLSAGPRGLRRFERECWRLWWFLPELFGGFAGFAVDFEVFGFRFERFITFQAVIFSLLNFFTQVTMITNHSSSQVIRFSL